MKGLLGPIMVIVWKDVLLELRSKDLLMSVVVFGLLVVVVFNFISHFCMEFLISRVAQRLLFDLRRAMYEHLQRISLSFMDKMEVGRLMSRLQGDVGSLQEFLETSVHAFGDIVLLMGIIGVLLWMEPTLGAMTLALLPILVLIRYFWLPIARKAFIQARITYALLSRTRVSYTSSKKDWS